jgi:predicted NAD-dependent protein-ADP-ribosyltransferase YbiA (DUF1768 family)
LNLVLFLGASVGSASDRASYPAHWWEEVPREEAAKWEILPQDAKEGEVILSKRNELGLLSNFAATPFVYREQRYASVEGFWQMMRYPEGPHDERALFPGIEWKHSRNDVAAMTGFEAKNAGKLAAANMKLMNIDWVSFEGEKFLYRSKEAGRHYELILEALRAKLAQNRSVYEVLMKTGDLILRADHAIDAQSPPEWHYDKLWMQIRAEEMKRKRR